MRPAIKAGAAYFLLIFSIGFVLGTFRVLVLIPRVGELSAVLIELPVILAMSWIICRVLLRRFAVSPQWAPRLGMGATALALLLLAEIGLSVILFDRSLDEHLAHYYSAVGSLGLAGQILYGTFPLLQR